MIPGEIYNPTIHGAVNAIRITEEAGCLPIAELVFAFGDSVKIAWSNSEERSKYEAGINAYTLIYDERIRNIPYERFLKNSGEKKLEPVKVVHDGATSIYSISERNNATIAASCRLRRTNDCILLGFEDVKTKSNEAFKKVIEEVMSYCKDFIPNSHFPDRPIRAILKETRTDEIDILKKFGFWVSDTPEYFYEDIICLEYKIN